MASIIDPRYASSLNDLYPRPDGSRPFDLRGLDVRRVALVALPTVPAYTTCSEYRDWAYDLGKDGRDLGPIHLLTHAFYAAAVGGYRAGKEDAAEEGRTALAWNLGRHAGVRGRSPRLPREYNEGEKDAYRDGWQAGDAEYRDFLADLHKQDTDEQPDPYAIEANTISESDWYEMSEGFVRYPEEEAIEVFGAKAYTDRM